jgi:hypothetical protein
MINRGRIRISGMAGRLTRNIPCGGQCRQIQAEPLSGEKRVPCWSCDSAIEAVERPWKKGFLGLSSDPFPAKEEDFKWKSKGSPSLEALITCSRSWSMMAPPECLRWLIFGHALWVPKYAS